ncbi:MAG: hypothetical protein LUD77_11515 [Clostridiales bacterium]|nr:hypothetical protein [Clostridiales bacterium]
MKTTDIKPDTKNIKEIIELYETAFPPNERYSPEEIFSLLEQDENVKYKAFYDKDELIGSMLFAVSDSVLYLLYMVVSEKNVPME